MCLCAETQEGLAAVTDDAFGEEADPRRGGTAGSPSSDAAGSSAGTTTLASLSVCYTTRTMIYTTTTINTSTINYLFRPTILLTTITTSPSHLASPCLHYDLLAPEHDGQAVASQLS